MYDEWEHDFCRSYSDGHNHRGLRGKRLAHYAHAYADICEERRVALPLAEFFERWNSGSFWGAETEHWRAAA